MKPEAARYTIWGLWVVTALCLVKALMGLAALSIAPAPYGADAVWVLVTMTVAAVIIARRQPPFAAVFALFASAYATAPIKEAWGVAPALEAFIPLVAWLMALEHPYPLKGTARSWAVKAAGASLGFGVLFVMLPQQASQALFWLVLMALILPAFSIVGYKIWKACRFRGRRTYIMLIALVPAVAFIIADEAFGFGAHLDNTITETVTNLFFSVGPVGCLATHFVEVIEDAKNTRSGTAH